LLLMVKTAVRGPVALGVKTTLNVHFAEGATVPQVEPLSANSDGLLLAMPATTAGPVPVLVSVIVRAALAVPCHCVPKARAPLCVRTPCAPRIPIPPAASGCGLPVPLWVIVSVLAREPVADGLKATWNVQFAPGLTVPQVTDEMGNSAALLLLTLDTVTAALPVFVSVIVRGADDVPTTWLPNDAVPESDKVPSAATMPVPVAVNVCGLVAPLLATVRVPDRDPVDDGLNATLNEHVFPGFTVPQVTLETGNSAAFELVTPCTTTGAGPTLVSVTVLAMLVVPTT
jgi:hypothetical protein